MRALVLMLFFQFIPHVSHSLDWALPAPNENVCISNPLPTIYGNGFDGKIENAINIQDELKKLPWNDVFVFLSPRERQWGSSELCLMLAHLGSFIRTQINDAKPDIAKTPVVGIGDIALQNGKQFDFHVAHQTGLDADLFYFRKFAKSLPLVNRWARKTNRFPEKFVIVSGKFSSNFDLLENFKAFAFLQKKFGAWITTDQSVIDGIRSLQKGAGSIEMNRFLKNSKHVDGHHDHFHLGIDCPASQTKCLNQWGEWHRLRKLGKKKWKSQYNP